MKTAALCLALVAAPVTWAGTLDDTATTLAVLSAAIEARAPYGSSQGGDTSYSIRGQDGYRWGWVNAQPTGEWFGWDNDRGYHWGRIEVQRDR